MKEKQLSFQVPMVRLQWSAIPLALSSPSRAMWLPIPATTKRHNSVVHAYEGRERA